MRRYLKYCLLLIYCVIYGCNSDTSFSTTTTFDSTINDTINYAADEDSLLMTTNTIQAPEGIYQGVLPCTDCKGIEHTVYFDTDLTYKLQETKMGKKGELPFTVSGTWRPSEGVIWLYKEGVVQSRYTWQRDTLVYMNAKTGKRYPLRKLTGAMDNDTWRAKGKAGIEFFGVGNEPFWNVEIDEQKSIAFHLAEWGGPMAFKPVRPLVNADSTVYQTGNDSATLRVVVYPTFCSDGMSDFIYNNSVKVVYKGQTYRGCGIRY